MHYENKIIVSFRTFKLGLKKKNVLFKRIAIYLQIKSLYPYKSQISRILLLLL